ncbi:MAG TPA: hydroxymethylbilane synthase [Steroidobacteraceae bacterium]|nr:hydroxymethylbilane synthase [Steroidobacteraceae bacterium]
MAKPLRLGTRRSTLAWAQSLWVAESLQAESGRPVELVPIETRGDRITDVPLRELEGKEFFTAEIDQALLSGAVDLTVHSLKDLSLERPAGIALGAIPRRENPRDVVVFHREARARLGRGERLRIGTSAPRRVENVPRFLERALPGGARGRIDCVEIRGNVDTRLGRLHEPDGNARKLDGVVLALAGLVRLWRDVRADGGRDKLTRLLRDTRWMVLPITDCPSAPGQGALAVECRGDDETVRALLASLNDTTTARLVGEERRVLSELGGGCHQQFGATCVEHPSCGPLLYIRGRGTRGESLDRVAWLAMPGAPSGRVLPWDGFRARESSDVPAASISAEVHAAFRRSVAPVFVAHSRALPAGIEAEIEERRVWTSGTGSWRRLAERGVWIEGCAEGLGYDWIASTLAEPLLGLPPLAEWQVLSHAGSADYWPAGEVIGTYRLPDVASQAIPDPGAVTHAYWASGSQFRELWSQLPPTVHHACGPGKTAEVIRAAGVHRLTVFPAVHEWRRWLKIDPHITD